jgi:hypothetical protein
MATVITVLDVLQQEKIMDKENVYFLTTLVRKYTNLTGQEKIAIVVSMDINLMVT